MKKIFKIVFVLLLLIPMFINTNTVKADDDTPSLDFYNVIVKPDKAINEADKESKQQGKDFIDEEKIEEFSSQIFKTLFSIGTVVAVIIGGFIGIKFLMASVEEKAKIKEILIPYVIGCIVIFGAFGIWRVVVTVLNNLN